MRNVVSKRTVNNWRAKPYLYKISTLWPSLFHAHEVVGLGGAAATVYAYALKAEIYTEKFSVQDGHGFFLLPPPPCRRGLSTKAHDETRAIFISVFSCMMKVL